MDIDGTIKLIAAIVAGLAVIGTGVGALIRWAVAGVLGALKDNTAAITVASERASTASADLRAELRVLRAEMRAHFGSANHDSDDGDGNGNGPDEVALGSPASGARGVPDIWPRPASGKGKVSK